MSTSLQNVTPGSLAQVARHTHTSIAETFASADHVIIVDVSGSMSDRDSRGGQSRYHVALEELAKLQKALPGKIAVIAFSDTAQFIPGGQPIMMGGGTALDVALTYSRPADVEGMHFVVISDGQPDSEAEALRIAKTYHNRIDTVFVGNENDAHAREFLRKLAAATGGQSARAERVIELAERVTTLLLDKAR